MSPIRAYAIPPAALAHPLANFFALPVVLRLHAMAQDAAREEPDVAKRISALLHRREPVLA